MIKKLVTIGCSGVGKTSIISTYYYGRTLPSQELTIGAAFFDLHSKEASNGSKVHIQVWDSAGQERYRAISQIYLRKCDAILAVYDVTNLQTLVNLEKIWLPLTSHIDPPPKIYIIGNKDDQKFEASAVKPEEDEIINRIKSVYTIEKVARTSIYKTYLINELMESVIDTLAAESEKEKREKEIDTISLKSENTAYRFGRCCLFPFI